MENKLTAVQWLIKNLMLNGLIRLTQDQHSLYKELTEEAKQMENEQRFEDFKQGFHSAFESLEAANNSVQSKTFKSE